jgi:selenocysteine lyase/cysteine desulfurase
MENYLEVWDEEGGAWPSWVAKNERVRELFAASIGAQPDEVAIVTSASIGVSALASALNFDGERNTVVFGDFEFPTMAYIWYAQQSRGARIHRVPASGGKPARVNTRSSEGTAQSRSGGFVSLNDMAGSLDERTLILAGTQVCYKNGSRTDPAALAEIAHRAGAFCIVDTYQCQGTEPVDVRAWDVDFLVTGALKYMLGPSGLAFLYVRKELIEGLVPTVAGWFGQEDPFAYNPTENRPSHSARRFEQGTPADSCIHGGIAALEMLEAMGYSRIKEQVRRLAGRFVDGALAMKLDLITPLDDARQGPNVTIRSIDAPALVDLLATRQVMTSLREDAVRFSFHAYNNEADVDAALNALETHRDLTAPG